MPKLSFVVFIVLLSSHLIVITSCCQHHRLRDFLTSSLAQTVWENLSFTNLSQPCQGSIDEVVRGFKEGQPWAYDFLDASSKTPSGLMEGTVTMFGDYDQCLAITANTDRPLYGQHCMIRLAYTNPECDEEIWSFFTKKLPVFEYYHLNIGLCFPATCSKTDIRKLVNDGLVGLPFQIFRDFVCDTKESTSFEEKISGSTFTQRIAMSYVTLVVGCVLLGSVSHLIGLEIPLVHHFSLIKNSKPLVSSKTVGSRLNLLDYVRLIIILAGVGGHCLSCLETVPGWYLIPRLHELKAKFATIWAQPLMNEGGLSLVSFVGGFVTFWSTNKVMARGDFRFGMAIFDRWIRYMPSLVSMVAIDLLWPFFSTGPMVTWISDHLIDKCGRFAWMNFFFLNNFNNAPDNCIPHTFYSSIDLQLFILGLLVTFILVKSPKLGVGICLSLIVTGNFLLMFFTSINKSSPVLIDAEATVPKTLNYLNYVHFANYGHLSGYFIGVLTGFLLTVEGFYERNVSLIRLLFNGALVLSSSIHFAPALHNTFGLLPQSLVPLYIVTIKFFYVFYYSLFLFTNFNRYANGGKPSEIVKKEPKVSKGFLAVMTNISLAGNTMVYDAMDTLAKSPVMKSIVNLSYAIYVCNYSYIRYDFFTSRTPMDMAPNTLYVLFRRWMYTLVIVYFLSYFFHCLFVAPFDNLRRTWNIRVDRRKNK